MIGLSYIDEYEDDDIFFEYDPEVRKQIEQRKRKQDQLAHEESVKRQRAKMKVPKWKTRWEEK